MIHDNAENSEELEKVLLAIKPADKDRWFIIAMPHFRLTRNKEIIGLQASLQDGDHWDQSLKQSDVRIRLIHIQTPGINYWDESQADINEVPPNLDIDVSGLGDLLGGGGLGGFGMDSGAMPHNERAIDTNPLPADEEEDDAPVISADGKSNGSR
jgi:hypothetical protein